MLASFFYGDWEPNAAEALDNLLGLIVAAEARQSVDADAAKTMVRGYLRVWEGAMAADDNPRDLNYVKGAEAFYTKAFFACFNAYRKKHGMTAVATAEDGIGWWPECMPSDREWPKILLRKIAETLAEVEANREQARIAYYNKMEAEKRAGTPD